MRYLRRTVRRRGTILPLLALMMIGLITMVALAMDIGLVAMARNQAQNAADAAALAGVRVLNGDTANEKLLKQALGPRTDQQLDDTSDD